MRYTDEQITALLDRLGVPNEPFAWNYLFDLAKKGKWKKFMAIALPVLEEIADFSKLGLYDEE